MTLVNTITGAGNLVNQKFPTWLLLTKMCCFSKIFGTHLICIWFLKLELLKFLNAHSESHGGRTIVKIRRVDFLLKELLLAMTFF